MLSDLQFSFLTILATTLIFIIYYLFIVPNLTPLPLSAYSAYTSEMTSRFAKPLVLRAPSKSTGTVIWLHGLGDSGNGWRSFGEELQRRLPSISFIFPHAVEMPITLNSGYRMPAWHDIKRLDKLDPTGFTNLEESRSYVTSLIDQTREEGTPSERIILGGFSQGAAMSVVSGYQYPHKLAGIIAFSGYLAHVDSASSSFKSSIASENLKTPCFIGHGTADDVVRYEAGVHLAEAMKAADVPVEFHTYKGMPHSTNMDEMVDVLAFIKKVLPSS